MVWNQNKLSCLTTEFRENSFNMTRGVEDIEGGDLQKHF